jgi:hypothetical protein
MIGWYVISGPDANLEDMTGVVVETQDMGAGVERVESVVVALHLVIGRRRVFRVNLGRDAYRSQPKYTLALLWEREQPDLRGSVGVGLRLTGHLRLYWHVGPADCSSRTKVKP